MADATMAPGLTEQTLEQLEAAFLRSEGGILSDVPASALQMLPTGAPDDDETEQRITRLRTRHGCC